MSSVSEQVTSTPRAARSSSGWRSENKGRQGHYVPKAVYEDDELIAPVFDIREAGDRQGNRVHRPQGQARSDHQGRLRRGQARRQKKPTASTSRHSYDFLAGEHTYKLTGPVAASSPISRTWNAATPALVPVMPVSFIFRK